MYINHHLTRALVEQHITELDRDYTKAPRRSTADAKPSEARRRVPQARAYLAYLRAAKGWSR
jgi:hypothetical protein